MTAGAAATPPQLSRLWLVRHGESAGNVASDRAESTGATAIELEGRDIDVPLSALGARQAAALGGWFAQLPEGERPDLIVSSPFVRAVRTAEILVERMGVRAPVWIQDERLREKEFGSLNRLTRAGVLARFPHEAAQRAQIGKFYYRPPGGESWCDVALRVRALIDHLRLFHAGARVLVVAHEVIILCARYILERLDERALLAIDQRGDVANCSITSYALRETGAFELTAYNFVAPLDAAGAPVTDAPDTAGRRA